MKKLFTTIQTLLFILAFTSFTSYAQIGSGWTDYTAREEARQKIHLQHDDLDKNTIDWTGNDQTETFSGTPSLANYAYKASTKTHTFNLIRDPGNRAEIRIHDDYDETDTDARQFEGYVTFNAQLDHQDLCQLWGSTTNATQLQVRGYKANGGSLGLNHSGGTPMFLSNKHNVEIKINIIHKQQGYILVYADNVLLLKFRDDENLSTDPKRPPNDRIKNYFKYGIYGTIRDGSENLQTKWRNVRYFVGGTETGGTNTPAAPTGLTATTISANQINLAWADNSSNETGFEVQRSTDGVTYSTITTTGSNATSYQVTGLNPNTLYYFRVRSVNTIGSSNFSSAATATTQQQSGNLFNDRTVGTGQNQFEYVGTWAVITGQAGNYNGDFTQSNTSGSYVNIRFTGTKIALYGKKKPDSGIGAFSIDGGTETNGDFYAAAETFQAKVWESPLLPYGTHTLKVRMQNLKAAASTAYYCRIDYAEITGVNAPTNLTYLYSMPTYSVGATITPNEPTITGDADSYSISPALPAGLTLNTTTGVITGTPTAASALTNYTITATNAAGSTSAVISILVTNLVLVNDDYIGTGQNQFEYVSTGATWTVIDGQENNYFSDFHQSATSGDYVNIRFTGTKISLYGKKKPDSGIGAFSIDGGSETDGDFYASAETFQSKVWESPVLPYGTHTLKVRMKNAKRTASTGYLCRIDYVEVDNQITAPTSLSYSSNPATYTVGTAITANTPTVGGTATVTSYSVSPALPAGLSLNTTTGVISGTPSASAASAVYVVTVSNSAGSATANVTITVNQSVITLNDRTTGTGQNQFEYVTTAQWAVITGQAGNYNSDFTQSATSGAYVNIRFTGTRIAIYGKKKPDSGIGAFSIDGGTESDGDFYAATETFQAKVWESPVLPYGTHILKVRMKNAKIAASTGYLCRIDYAVVTNAGTGATLSKNNTVASLQLERESTVSTLSLNYIGGNVTFDLPASGYTTLDVYNLNGQKVAALVKGNKTAGAHSAALNSRNLAAGLYIIRLTSGKDAKAIKVLLQ